LAASLAGIDGEAEHGDGGGAKIVWIGGGGDGGVQGGECDGVEVGDLDVGGHGGSAG